MPEDGFLYEPTLVSKTSPFMHPIKTPDSPIPKLVGVGGDIGKVSRKMPHTGNGYVVEVVEATPSEYKHLYTVCKLTMFVKQKKVPNLPKQQQGTKGKQSESSK